VSLTKLANDRLSLIEAYERNDAKQCLRFPGVNQQKTQYMALLCKFDALMKEDKKIVFNEFVTECNIHMQRRLHDSVEQMARFLLSSSLYKKEDSKPLDQNHIKKLLPAITYCHRQVYDLDPSMSFAPFLEMIMSDKDSKIKVLLQTEEWKTFALSVMTFCWVCLNSEPRIELVSGIPGDAYRDDFFLYVKCPQKVGQMTIESSVYPALIASMFKDSAPTVIVKGRVHVK
jgi:hypothetical protein